jgi:LysM repeat protein/ABC-type branched-subunit amino acid transport system substrate-binding protein
VNANFQVKRRIFREAVFIIILVFITLSGNLNAQFQPTPVTRSNNQITLGGKDYYMHEVLKGQTLYGISKAYNVPEETLKQLNPDLKTKAVAPGMVLRIPDDGRGSSVADTKQAGGFIDHTVLPKETLFSISRQYGIKLDELKELNTEAVKGLKTGQILKIPKDRITITQPATVTPATNAAIDNPPATQAAETVQSGVPCTAKPFPHEKEHFKLAILLPLNINQNDTLNYSDTLGDKHFRFYEFLEGVYIAIDSMRSAGLNMTVEIFDTEKSPATIRGIIEDGRIKDADLIIGPVFLNEIEVVAPYAKSRQIPVVSPLSSFDIAKDNPYAFQVRNQLSERIELATAYLGTRYNQNMILIGRAAEKNNPEFVHFQALLAAQVKANDPAGKATVRTIYFNESGRNFTTAESKAIQIEQVLSATRPNYIVLPSDDKVFITELINQLHQKTNTFELHTFGLNQWIYEDLDLGNLYNVGLELYSDLEEYPYIDFNDPAVAKFCSAYKMNWNSEPSRYSFQGFDITWYFAQALFQFGRNLTSLVPCWPEYLTHTSLLTAMKFERTGSGNGFGNHAVTIVRYNKDEMVVKKAN